VTADEDDDDDDIHLDAHRVPPYDSGIPDQGFGGTHQYGVRKPVTRFTPSSP